VHLYWQRALVNAAINSVLPSRMGMELLKTVDEVASVGQHGHMGSDGVTQNQFIPVP